MMSGHSFDWTEPSSNPAMTAIPKTIAEIEVMSHDVPKLFRLTVEVGDFDLASRFYATLFGIAGERQAGSRCYFTCGPVTLQIVDVSSVGEPHPAGEIAVLHCERSRRHLRTREAAGVPLP